MSKEQAARMSFGGASTDGTQYWRGFIGRRYPRPQYLVARSYGWRGRKWWIARYWFSPPTRRWPCPPMVEPCMWRFRSRLEAEMAFAEMVRQIEAHPKEKLDWP